jgi:Pyruvate/2-oxoacid:ferredoxin oxidoreductase delta subunit
MLHPVIDWSSCQVCSPCLARKVCKPRALMQIDLDDPPYIDYPRCTSCGLCVQACPSAAITMQNTKIPNMHRVIR